MIVKGWGGLYVETFETCEGGGGSERVSLCPLWGTSLRATVILMFECFPRQARADLRKAPN